MVITMALDTRGGRIDSLRETDRILADADATAVRLVKELEELQIYLRRVREVLREKQLQEAEDDV